MNDRFDLDAYLARIGWSGEVRHDLASLSSLLRAHMMRIPFENLDVLMRRPIRLDLEGVQAKLVEASRGGYCFEHGTLFAAALEALGFAPTRHVARVTMVVPREQAPRTHMFLIVPVEQGHFVVDPGFGSMAPRVPVPLVHGRRAAIGDEAHEMVHEGGLWTLRAHLGGKTIDAWVSTLEEENPIDFEMGNHYTATHPQSAFVNRLMMRALIEDGRVAVLNRDVTIWRGKQSESRVLADRAALNELLASYFGFSLPDIEQLRVPAIPEWD